MNDVFISSCGSKYICVLDGVPCFTRTTHQQMIESKGLSLGTMKNLTFDFYYNGKGKSIKNFLENN